MGFRKNLNRDKKKGLDVCLRIQPCCYDIRHLFSINQIEIFFIFLNRPCHSTKDIPFFLEIIPVIRNQIAFMVICIIRNQIAFMVICIIRNQITFIVICIIRSQIIFMVIRISRNQITLWIFNV